MSEVTDLRVDLYKIPSCGVGGPLHIVTDDANVADSDLDFCENELADHWSILEATDAEREEIRHLSRQILAQLRPLTERQRLVALGFPADYNDHPCASRP